MPSWRNVQREPGALLSPIALAVTTALVAWPCWATPSARFERNAPAGFKGAASSGIERTLLFRGRTISGITWVETAQAGRYVLSQQSIGSFRRLLIEAGFDREASDTFALQAYHEGGVVNCLPLESAKESCIEFTLEALVRKSSEAVAGDSTQDAGKLIELRFPAHAQPKLIPEQVVSEASSVGFASFYGSWAESSDSKQTNSFGTVQRGVMSRGAARFEYDLSAVSIHNRDSGASTSNDTSSTRLQYNTLAAGFRQDAGTAYGGLFRGAAAGQGFGLATGMFFSKPLQLGVAWQSSNSNLASLNQKQRVRLQLLSPSYVRIQHNGVQLYEGQLAAGDQWVTFSGFADAFVDVIIRGISGQESTIRAATESVNEVAASNTIGMDRHMWHFDAGQLLKSSGFDNRNLETLDKIQASGSYSYLFDAFALSLGGQIIGEQKRISTSAYDRGGVWRATAMAGGGNESGINIGLTPRMGDLMVGGTFTRYMPPKISGGISPNCQIGVMNICLSNSPHGYRAWNASIGHRGIPLTLSANIFDDGINRTTRYLATLAASPSFFRGATFLALGSYDPDKREKSLMLNIAIPLSLDGGPAMINSSFSTDFNGNSSLNTGYSQAFNPTQEYVVRSVSASFSGAQQNGGDRTHSANAYLTSQLGAVTNSLAASTSNGSAKAVNASFTTNFGASTSGVAFGRDSQQIPIGDLFSGNDYAGISVINRSQETQTVQLGERKIEVSAQSSVLIPVSQGVVKNVTVTPGPVSNPDEVSAPRTLFKGNLKTITIEAGFWIIAKFRNDANPARPLIPVRYTFKRPNEQVEKLHPDRHGAAMLFEFKENGDRIERFVVGNNPDDQYNCAMPASDMPSQEDAAIYKEIVYSCQPWEDPYKSRKTTPTKVVDASPEPALIRADNVLASAPAPRAVTPDLVNREVRARIEDWKNAWMSRDLGRYLAAYAGDFEPASGTRQNWECQRRTRISSQDNIQIELQDMEVVVTDNRHATVRFRQTYRSRQYSDVTRKTLELIQTDKHWLILREKAVPIPMAGMKKAAP